MNSRFKSFGFGKRKSTASIQSPEGATPSHTPPPSQIPQHQLPHLRQTTPLGASSSTTSLPMNHPGTGNRPPSYSANYPQNPQGAPLRQSSPLTNQGPNRTPPSQMAGGPPPINTGAPVGYPPNMAPMGQGPPQHMGPPGGPPGPPGGPPGFGGQTGYPPAGGPPPPGPIAQQFQQGNPAAEVEGASKSKAQLIVGIDFVRNHNLLSGHRSYSHDCSHFRC